MIIKYNFSFSNKRNMSFENVTVANNTGRNMPYFTYKDNELSYITHDQTQRTLKDGDSFPVIGVITKSKSPKFASQGDNFLGKNALKGYITITTPDDTVYEVPESSINQSKSVKEHRTPIIKYGGSVGNAQKAIQEKIKASTVYIGGGQSLSTYEHKPEYVFSTRFGQWFINEDDKNPTSFRIVLDDLKPLTDEQKTLIGDAVLKNKSNRIVMDIPSKYFNVTYQFRSRKSPKKVRKSPKKVRKSPKKSKKSPKKVRKSSKKSKKSPKKKSVRK
jgi:hypothetical protein